MRTHAGTMAMVSGLRPHQGAAHHAVRNRLDLHHGRPAQQIGSRPAQKRSTKSGASLPPPSRRVVTGPPRRWLAPPARHHASAVLCACGHAVRPWPGVRHAPLAHCRSDARLRARSGSAAAARHPPRREPTGDGQARRSSRRARRRAGGHPGDWEGGLVRPHEPEDPGGIVPVSRAN